MPVIPTFDAYIDVGGLWVRYDQIATIKDVERDGGPYCQVVLTVPGFKTLGVSCNSAMLLDAIRRCATVTEHNIGYDRSRGMLDYNNGQNDLARAAAVKK